MCDKIIGFLRNILSGDPMFISVVDITYTCLINVTNQISPMVISPMVIFVLLNQTYIIYIYIYISAVDAKTSCFLTVFSGFSDVFFHPAEGDFDWAVWHADGTWSRDDVHPFHGPTSAAGSLPGQLRVRQHCNSRKTSRDGYYCKSSAS